jgi:hypothetical protein
MTVVQAQEARVFWSIIFIRCSRGGSVLSPELAPLETLGPVKGPTLGTEDAMMAGRGKGGTGEGAGGGAQYVNDGLAGLERGATRALSYGEAG